MGLQIITTEAKLRLVGDKDCFLAAHPNEDKMYDPDYTGEGIAPLVPKYTDAEWLDEVIKQYIVGELEIGDIILKRAAIEKRVFDYDTE